MEKTNKKTIKKMTIALVAVMLFTVSACGGKPTDSGSQPNDVSTSQSEIGSSSGSVSSEIRILPDKTELSIEADKTTTLNVSVENYSGTVAFSTKDTGVFSVRKIDNGSATVTGKKAGTGTITVTAGDQTASVGVTVNAVDSLRLNLSRMTIYSDGDVSAPVTLKATYSAAVAGDKVVYTSSEPAVVTVTSDDAGMAVLTGKGVGRASITAKLGKAEAVCEVEVTNSGILYGEFQNQLWVSGLKEGTNLRGKVYIPEVMWDGVSYQSVMGVKEGVFENQANITSAYIGYNVKCISERAFRNTGLKEVEFQMDTSKESQIRTIAGRAFAGTKLTSVVIPNTQNGYYFGPGVFYNCSLLTSVQLPDALTTILADTFVGTALKTIYFGYLGETLDTSGNPVPAVHANAFSADAALENVYYIGSRAEWQGMLTGCDSAVLKALDPAAIHYNAKGING